MRIHTVASLAVIGMGTTSIAAWQIAPATSAAANEPEDRPAIAADSDPSRFVSGETLELEGRIGHARLLDSQREQSTFVLATVTGANDARAASTSLDLTIVVDSSGSMRGSRLFNAIEGARGMVRRLRDDDRVTVITYSSQAQLIVSPTVIDPISRERVVSALSNIEASGDTCISCGIDLAMQIAPAGSERVRRILLLSDGEATAGVRDLAGFQAIAERCRAMGTTVTTVGVDVEYNDRIMGALARSSNGAHYFVESPSGLPAVFDRELASLTQTIADDAELVVELADGVEVEQVFDRAVERDGRNRLVVPIGTLAPGEQKTFLVGVRVAIGRDPVQPIAEVRLRYDDLVRRTQGECEGSLAARTTSDPSEASTLDPFVSARVSRSQTVQALQDANELAAAGRFDEADRTLRDVANRVREQRNEVARRAPRPMRAALEGDFDAQATALEGSRGRFASPALAAPPESAEGRAARREAAIQSRTNTSEVIDPFSR